MANKLKPCMLCGNKRLWTVRVHPLRWIFTKYYIECSRCHCCGHTKIGKRRAEKAWNEMVELYELLKARRRGEGIEDGK